MGGEIMRKAGLFAITLIAACWAVQDARAQPEPADAKRWTVLASLSLPDAGASFNSRGLVDFLDANDFGDDGSFFDESFEYPYASTEGAAWTLAAAYAVRPRLSAGGFFHRAMDVEVAGQRLAPDPAPSGYITLRQRMWAVAPIVLWKAGRVLLVGGGPAYLRGETAPYRAAAEERVEAQKTSFHRLGAVLFASMGYTTLGGYLYLGVQGQFLYGGKAEIGPFETEESFDFIDPERIRLNARKASLNQWTVGPVIALHL